VPGIVDATGDFDLRFCQIIESRVRGIRRLGDRSVGRPSLGRRVSHPGNSENSDYRFGTVLDTLKRSSTLRSPFGESLAQFARLTFGKRAARYRQGGGLVELLIVTGTLALLATVLLPRTLSSRAQATRIACVNNLKQTGLASRMWASDHDKLFPWQVCTNEKGSFEFIQSGKVSPLLLPTSSEVPSPKVFWCPADNRRISTESFAEFHDQNVSYFVGLDASEEHPETILSGDRNISVDGKTGPRLVSIAAETALAWTKDLHNRAGNVGLVDGSVQQLTDGGLQREAKVQSKIFRLAIP